MSISKFIAAAAMAIVLTVPCKAALNINNGIAAGKALYALYTQYKADGKMDFSNTSNLANLATLATNVKGLTSKTDNTNFISGLISGSKNLVTTKNSDSVISSLTSIAGLDANSITSALTSSATSLVTSKLGGNKATTNATTDTAAKVLTSLFSGLK